MIQSARVDSRYRLSSQVATELATNVGTPLYVLDEGHFRARIRRYLKAFRAVSPGAEISFASKANSTLAVLAIAHQEGCGIDVASEGELRAAILAGVPTSQCHMHGNNKAEGELRFALKVGIGQIVVDSFTEIEMLTRLDARCEIVLRLAPGVDPVTHHKISTGQADTKFGFNIADGAALEATERCLSSGLRLIGFHCHVGSQLHDPEAQRTGGESIAKFAGDVKQQLGFEATVINIGGGLGVRYTDDDNPPEVEDYCRLVVEATSKVLKEANLSPKLCQEPGRSLIAESGVTLYRVGPIKDVPVAGGSRTYVSVDGGLSDNPRPSMYDSRYTVEKIGGSQAPGRKVTVAGKHCETDTLFQDALLPADVRTGDLLQVLCTGAYNSSMASNYNRFPRPATVLIRLEGSVSVIQQQESWDEMFAREAVPKDLKK